MSKDLSVQDLVLPLDVEESSEAGCVEVIKLPGVTLIHCPHFTGAKQRVEYCYPVHLQFQLMPVLFQTLACSLPNDALAFAMLVMTSSSMTTCLDSVLHKYVNLFTTFSLWPLAVTLASMYGFPGAG